jgi:hypothetical protein
MDVYIMDMCMSMYACVCTHTHTLTLGSVSLENSDNYTSLPCSIHSSLATTLTHLSLLFTASLPKHPHLLNFHWLNSQYQPGFCRKTTGTALLKEISNILWVKLVDTFSSCLTGPSWFLKLFFFPLALERLLSSCVLSTSPTISPQTLFWFAYEVFPLSPQKAMCWRPGPYLAYPIMKGEWWPNQWINTLMNS